jgi:hypothetical protein
MRRPGWQDLETAAAKQAAASQLDGSLPTNFNTHDGLARNDKEGVPSGPSNSEATTPASHR